MTKKTVLIFLALAMLFSAGCTKSGPTLKAEILNDQVQKMAEVGYDSLPSLTSTGKLSLGGAKGRGSADFVMLFDPALGFRLEVVDPFYRPLQIFIYSKGKGYAFDPRSKRISSGPTEKVLKNLTGFALPAEKLLPLIFGKIPPGGHDLTAVPSKTCMADPEKYACFDMRDPEGRLSCMAEISLSEGTLHAVSIPEPHRERLEFRAEYSGFHFLGISRKVKISHLNSNDFVIIRYTDIETGKKLEPGMFDPAQLQDNSES